MGYQGRRSQTHGGTQGGAQGDTRHTKGYIRETYGATRETKGDETRHREERGIRAGDHRKRNKAEVKRETPKPLPFWLMMPCFFSFTLSESNCLIATCCVKATQCLPNNRWSLRRGISSCSCAKRTRSSTRTSTSDVRYSVQAPLFRSYPRRLWF